MTIALVVITAVVIIAVVALVLYLYGNMHYDHNQMVATEEAGFVEKQVTLDDGSVINYAEGPDNGPAVLFIHGQGMAWEDYFRVLPDLAKNYQVYAVDCFGHGQSSHDVSLYSCTSNGEALIWFMENVIGKRCIVSGHSSGGVMAAWIAANAPQDVSGLLLEDPPLFRVTPAEMQEGTGSFVWKDSFEPLHAFLNQSEETDWQIYYLEHSYFVGMFGGLQGRIVKWAREYRADHPTDPLKIAYIPHVWIRGLYYANDYDPLFGETFYDGSWLMQVDQAAMLEGIQCRTVYLKAATMYGKDGVLYAANTDEDVVKVQSLIEDCETITLQAQHDIHYDKPRDFISALELLSRKID